MVVKFGEESTVSFNPKEFNGFVKNDNNWHCHGLITTRRFQSNGLDFGEKARDRMPVVANGKVVSGPNYFQLSTDHQNRYFQEKGLDLRVDSSGIVPVRMSLS